MVPYIQNPPWNKRRYKRWLGMLAADRSFLEAELTRQLRRAELHSRTFPGCLMKRHAFRLMDDILLFDRQHLHSRIHTTHRNTT